MTGSENETRLPNQAGVSIVASGQQTGQSAGWPTPRLRIGQWEFVTFDVARRFFSA